LKADDRIPLIAHLTELRKRLMIALGAVLACFIAATFFAKELYGILAAPIVAALPPGSSLTMLRPEEGFFTYLKVAFFAGLLVASPVVLLQIWLFVGPALYKKERRVFIGTVFASSVLFLSGVAFAYYVVFPYAFRFFMTYATGPITATLSIGWYLSLSTKLLLAFGLVFELPVAIFVLARLGFVTAGFLLRNFRYALVLIFLIAAVLTPTPDVFTQLLMAGPLLILYGLSIIIAAVVGKQRAARKAAAAAEQAASD
jgi:sec-independent protein translocase protein TatC